VAQQLSIEGQLRTTVPSDIDDSSLTAIAAMIQATQIEATSQAIATKQKGIEATQTAIASHRNLTFTVFANQAWQASDIYVSIGEIVHIAYQSGQWRVADWAEFTDGKGYPRYEGYDPEFAHGSLIAQIDDGPILPILNESQFTASQSGIISFRINDSDTFLYDNVGNITITIDVSQ
jgi:hypothetical protein